MISLEKMRREVASTVVGLTQASSENSGLEALKSNTSPKVTFALPEKVTALLVSLVSRPGWLRVVPAP